RETLGPRLYTEDAWASTKSCTCGGCQILAGCALLGHAVYSMTFQRRARPCGLWLLISLSYLGTSLGGCARQRVQRLALAQLERLSLRQGDALELRGEQLPMGLGGEVELRGVMHAPGRPERKLEASLQARVVSPERVSVAIDPARFSPWRRGSFEGEL